MRFREGTAIFYRAVAGYLVVDFEHAGPIELVLDGQDAFPDEDVYALASAIATRATDTNVAPQILNLRELDVGNVRALPLVVDARGGDASADSVRQKLPADSSELVVLRHGGQAKLGFKQIPFTKNARLTFEAVTVGLSTLLNALAWEGPAVELPSRYLTGGLRQIGADFWLFDEIAGQVAFSPERIRRFCQAVCQSWTYVGQAVAADEVFQWVTQFEALGAIREAINLIEYIQREGYLSRWEISARLAKIWEIQKARLPQSQMVALQRNGKSEQMLLYELRAAGEVVSLADVVSGRVKRDHLLCVDDVVGSGATVLQCLFQGAGQVGRGEFENWLHAGDRSLTAMAAVASETGVQAIETDARGGGRVRVIAAEVLRREAGVFGLQSKVYSNPQQRSAFRKVCVELGMRLTPDYPLGWGDCEWAIVTDYNVPDCSLPVIWKTDPSVPWFALFERR